MELALRFSPARRAPAAKGLAIGAGYADQARLSRGFKFSCGLTPGQTAQALAA